MKLSDFFVFVFLFDLVGDQTDVLVVGGQLCARTFGWKRLESSTGRSSSSTLASGVR